MKIKDCINLLSNNQLIIQTNIPNVIQDTEIAKVSYNSKDVLPNTLFICKGLKYKEEYLLEAIKNGAIAYVAEEKKNVGNDFPYIIVNDIRKALALISALFFDFPMKKINMIGITGTKGKSTTAYYIKNILDIEMQKQGKKDTAIISSIDTYDGYSKEASLLTCPESLELSNHIRNAVNSNIENLVMEVSSQALKLNRVYGILYKVGVFLNISEDHISPVEHPTFEDYFTSKLELFKQTENAVINLDSDFADDVIKSAANCKKIISFSTRDENANIFAYNIKKIGQTSICFKIKSNDEEIDEKEFILNMPGLFNVDNALSAIACTRLLNTSYSSIYEGLKNASVPGRMEILTSNKNDTVVIVDYAHNKLSFEKIFESTKKEYPNKKIVVVFGCPGGKALIRRMHLGEIAGEKADISYLTADDPGPEKVIDICNEIATYIKSKNGNYKIIEERGEAIKTALLENQNSIILILGKGQEKLQKCSSGNVEYLGDMNYVRKYLE